jgi:hypothetical protein
VPGPRRALLQREQHDVRTELLRREREGQNILVGFFFGADSSISYRGWAIKWLRIGGTDISPVENSSWGSIKALYR